MVFNNFIKLQAGCATSILGEKRAEEGCRGVGYTPLIKPSNTAKRFSSKKVKCTKKNLSQRIKNCNDK